MADFAKFIPLLLALAIFVDGQTQDEIKKIEPSFDQKNMLDVVPGWNVFSFELTNVNLANYFLKMYYFDGDKNLDLGVERFLVSSEKLYSFGGAYDTVCNPPQVVYDKKRSPTSEPSCFEGRPRTNSTSGKWGDKDALFNTLSTTHKSGKTSTWYMYISVYGQAGTSPEGSTPVTTQVSLDLDVYSNEDVLFLGIPPEEGMAMSRSSKSGFFYIVYEQPDEYEGYVEMRISSSDTEKFSPRVYSDDRAPDPRKIYADAKLSMRQSGAVSLYRKTIILVTSFDGEKEFSALIEMELTSWSQRDDDSFIAGIIAVFAFELPLLGLLIWRGKVKNIIREYSSKPVLKKVRRATIANFLVIAVGILLTVSSPNAWMIQGLWIYISSIPVIYGALKLKPNFLMWSIVVNSFNMPITICLGWINLMVHGVLAVLHLSVFIAFLPAIIFSIKAYRGLIEDRVQLGSEMRIQELPQADEGEIGSALPSAPVGQISSSTIENDVVVDSVPLYTTDTTIN